MIAKQIKKRDNSFLIVLLIIGVFIFGIFIAEKFLPKPDSDIVSTLVYCGIALISLGNIFLFKAFYHWSKAKGYPGAYTLLIFLGPLGLIILYYLRDLSIEGEEA